MQGIPQDAREALEAVARSLDLDLTVGRARITAEFQDGELVNADWARIRVGSEVVSGYGLAPRSERA